MQPKPSRTARTAAEAGGQPAASSQPGRSGPTPFCRLPLSEATFARPTTALTGSRTVGDLPDNNHSGRHRSALRSSTTWTSSSGEAGPLAGAEQVDSREQWVAEYSRLAAKYGVRTSCLTDFANTTGSRSRSMPYKKGRWISRVLRQTSGQSTTTADPLADLRNKRSISDVASSLVHPHARDGFKNEDLQGLVRLCGKSLLYLPAEYAPCPLVLPTCLRATAQCLVQHAGVRGLFRVSGSIRVVNAIYDYYCVAPDSGDIARTTRCPNLPLHIKYAPHDVASAFKRLLSGLPGGILGSLSLFDTLVAIYSQLDGDLEFAKTKETRIRARLIALAIGTVKSQYQRELICAVFGLLCLVGRIAENAPREDEAGRPLPTSDLTDYGSLGIMFGPLLVGDLIDSYSAKIADPAAGLILLPVTPPKPKKRRWKKGKPSTAQDTPFKSVDKIHVANNIAEMLIVHWREVVRHLSDLNVLRTHKNPHNFEPVKDSLLHSLRPSASDSLALQIPSDWAFVAPRQPAEDQDAFSRPMTPGALSYCGPYIGSAKPKSFPKSSQKVSARPSANMLSPTIEESASLDTGIKGSKSMSGIGSSRGISKQGIRETQSYGNLPPNQDFVLTIDLSAGVPRENPDSSRHVRQDPLVEPARAAHMVKQSNNDSRRRNTYHHNPLRIEESRGPGRRATLHHYPLQTAEAGESSIQQAPPEVQRANLYDKTRHFALNTDDNCSVSDAENVPLGESREKRGPGDFTPYFPRVRHGSKADLHHERRPPKNDKSLPSLDTTEAAFCSKDFPLKPSNALAQAGIPIKSPRESPHASRMTLVGAGLADPFWTTGGQEPLKNPNRLSYRRRMEPLRKESPGTKWNSLVKASPRNSISSLREKRLLRSGRNSSSRQSEESDSTDLRQSMLDVKNPPLRGNNEAKARPHRISPEKRALFEQPPRSVFPKVEDSPAKANDISPTRSINGGPRRQTPRRSTSRPVSGAVKALAARFNIAASGSPEKSAMGHFRSPTKEGSSLNSSPYTQDKKNAFSDKLLTTPVRDSLPWATAGLTRGLESETQTVPDENSRVTAGMLENELPMPRQRNGKCATDPPRPPKSQLVAADPAISQTGQPTQMIRGTADGPRTLGGARSTDTIVPPGSSSPMAPDRRRPPPPPPPVATGGPEASPSSSLSSNRDKASAPPAPTPGDETPRGAGSNSVLHARVCALQRRLDAQAEESKQLRRQLDALRPERRDGQDDEGANDDGENVGRRDERPCTDGRRCQAWRRRAEAAERRVAVFERFARRVRGLRKAAVGGAAVGDGRGVDRSADGKEIAEKGLGQDGGEEGGEDGEGKRHGGEREMRRVRFGGVDGAGDAREDGTRWGEENGDGEMEEEAVVEEGDGLVEKREDAAGDDGAAGGQEVDGNAAQGKDAGCRRASPDPAGESLGCQGASWATRELWLAAEEMLAARETAE